MDDTQLLIVGGGPAGLATAAAAADAGVETIVFEREAAIGDPVHTSGGISKRAAAALGIPARCHHTVGRLRIASPNEDAVWEFAGPTAAILDVRGTYRHLASVAESAGARIRLNAHAIEPVARGGAVRGVRYRDDGAEREIGSRVLVDASGYRASIARAAGLHPGFTRYGVGAEYELVAPKCRQDEAVIVVGSRYAPAGYAWVFPWGEQRVRVGVGILHADSDANPKEYLDRFVRDASSVGVDLGEMVITEKHFGLIPSEGVAPRFTGDGIIAVGDAAGQASQVVGEGIRLSIIAGRIAGAVAARAITRGDVSRTGLRPYEIAFRRRFGFALKAGMLLNRRMARWTDDDWDRKVEMARRMPPSLIVDLLQSDFSLPRILGFVARHPRAWAGAVRYGVKAASALVAFEPGAP